MVHGKPRHSQSQGSVERANQDVRDSLVAWMSDNQCQNWAKGLRIIQSTKNRSFHTGIKRTPYEAMFGSPQKNGLLDTCLDTSVINTIKTEEQLEEHLKLIKESLETNTINEEPNATTTESELETEMEIETENDSGDGNFNDDNKNDTDSMTKCFICDNMYVPCIQNVCIECNESLHIECAANLDLPLCQLCSNKRAADMERKGCKRGLEKQADKMLAQSQQKFPPANIGDNVLVNIPEVDRGRLAPRNVLAIIIDKTDQGFYILGTKNGKLKRLYSRNEFQLSPSVFLSLSEVPSDSSVNVREEAKLSSGSKQGFIRCNCWKGCHTKACKCLKSNIKCNSKCHKSTSCKNK